MVDTFPPPIKLASNLLVADNVPCLPSNAACNPDVLAIVKSPSPIVACLPSNADCNPDVLAIVRSPSPIVACLLSICVWTLLVTPSK